MTDPRDQIIVALDGDPHEASEWAQELSGTARWAKIGMTLFYLTGPVIVKELHALGYRVFMDLKLHDIPNQVEGAAERLARLGVDLITVHAFGGRDMMTAAMKGAVCGAEAVQKPAPAIIAVTVLTSMSDADLNAVGVSDKVEQEVSRLRGLACSADGLGSGLNGIVCSPLEAAEARKALGQDAWIVTPGVRPAGAEAGDQTRVMTPSEALAAGASHLVIGRPITQAQDRVQAFNDIVAGIESERT